MHESRSPALPHLSPPVPREEPLKCALTCPPREIPRHCRTFSLDRGQRHYYLDYPSDVPSLASGDTVIPDTEPKGIEELWKCIREDLEIDYGAPKEAICPLDLWETGNPEVSKINRKTRSDPTSEVLSLSYSARTRKASIYSKGKAVDDIMVATPLVLDVFEGLRLKSTYGVNRAILLGSPVISQFYNIHLLHSRCHGWYHCPTRQTTPPVIKHIPIPSS